MSVGPDLPPKSHSTLHKLTLKRNSLIGDLGNYCIQKYECYDLPRAKDFIRTYTCEFFDILKEAYGGLAFYREDEVADEAIAIAVACWANFNVHPKGDFWASTLRATIVQHLGRNLRKQQTSDTYVASGVDLASASPLLKMAVTPQTGTHLQPPNVPSVWAPVLRDARTEVPRPTSIKEQLKQLLIDCRWRPEDIAEEIGIQPRNVYRHLAGETFPTLVNVGKYEKAISKRLGRPVKLPTPSKRQ